VLDLATVGPGERLDVLGPAPAGFERAVADHVSGQLDQFDLALPLLERPHLIG
jgi:hypothetical protein